MMKMQKIFKINLSKKRRYVYSTLKWINPKKLTIIPQIIILTHQNLRYNNRAVMRLADEKGYLRKKNLENNNKNTENE